MRVISALILSFLLAFPALADSPLLLTSVGNTGFQPPPQVVQTRLCDSGGTRNTTVNVTGWTAVTAGNLIIVDFTQEMNSVTALTIPTGYSNAYTSITGTNIRIQSFYKTASGGETGFSSTTGANRWSCVMREISGWSGTPEFATSSGSSANPAPPTLAPSTGLKNYLFIANSSMTNAATVNSFPSGYGNNQSAISTNLTPTVLSTSDRTSITSSESPGAYGLSASASWLTSTASVSP